jgi:hypothetical protein
VKTERQMSTLDHHRTDVLAAQPRKEREILWHALTTSHLQRGMIIEALERLNGKMDRIIEILGWSALDETIPQRFLASQSTEESERRRT